MATQTCSKCSTSFKVMEDESNDLFNCPHCGWDGMATFTAHLTLSFRARDEESAVETFYEKMADLAFDRTNLEVERERDVMVSTPSWRGEPWLLIE